MEDDFAVIPRDEGDPRPRENPPPRGDEEDEIEPIEAEDDPETFDDEELEGLSEPD